MENKNLVGALILLVFISIIGYVIPISLVLGNSEISNPAYTFQLNLFQGILFAGVIGIVLLYLARFLIKKDNIYGDSFGFFNIGESPSLSFFKRFTAFQLTLLTTISLSILFLITNLLKFKGFTSAKILPQQFSPTESLVFSSLLIPTAEECLAMLITGFLVLVLVYFSIKYKLKKSDFNTNYFLTIPIIVGIVAVIWHISAYGNSDIGLGVVFTFWTIKALLNLAIGFFVFGWIFHTLNNFFIDYSRLFSSDIVLMTTIAIILILVAIYFFIYRGRLFGTNKTVEQIL
jgi:hypothetical protein